MITLSILVAVVFLVVLYLNYAPQIGGKQNEMELAKLRQSPHFKDGKFVNLVPTPMPAPKFSTMVEFFKSGENRTPGKQTKTASFDGEQFMDNETDTDIHFTWFGHSSVLIRMEGKNILFDPVFGERASMVSFAGPKKYNYSNEIKVSDLPPINAVLISHDHYDHLDYTTIRQLNRQGTRFYVPLGVGIHLKRWGVQEAYITELDWWQEALFDNLTVALTPTRHFSGRGLTNRDKTLWGAWSVMGRHRKVFFSGDSGYFDGFKQVGQKYGPFDLAFVECGQYNEEWANIHMMPEESAQVGEDLKAQQVVPIHWGKFALSLHSWTDPVERFLLAAKHKKYQVSTPVPGQVMALSDTKIQYWWQSLTTSDMIGARQTSEYISF